MFECGVQKIVHINKTAKIQRNNSMKAKTEIKVQCLFTAKKKSKYETSFRMFIVYFCRR